MKLNETPRLAQNDPLMQRELREHATQVNQLAAGRISAVDNAMTAIPTTGDWKRGDFIRNPAPSVINLIIKESEAILAICLIVALAVMEKDPLIDVFSSLS